MLASFFSIFILSYTGGRIQDIFSDNEYAASRDLALALQREITLAASVDPGYSRKLMVPPDANGISYTTQIKGTVLILSTENYDQVLNIPMATGNFVPGELNMVNNSNGTIYVG